MPTSDAHVRSRSQAPGAGTPSCLLGRGTNRSVTHTLREVFVVPFHPLLRYRKEKAPRFPVVAVVAGQREEAVSGHPDLCSDSCRNPSL